MSSGSPLPNPTMALTRQNWVLVDYENVQNIDLDLVAGMPVNVILFIGQQQKSVPVALLTKALAMKEQVTVIESAGTGKNAMDFQIAFQAGRITEAHPEAYVHFVSKDKGFEVLVKHMKSRKLFADQAASFASLRFLAAKAEFKVVPRPRGPSTSSSACGSRRRHHGPARNARCFPPSPHVRKEACCWRGRERGDTTDRQRDSCCWGERRGHLFAVVVTKTD